MAPLSGKFRFCNHINATPIAGANIGGRLTVAIEGGFPYKPWTAPTPICDIFVNVRLRALEAVHQK